MSKISNSLKLKLQNSFQCTVSEIDANYLFCNEAQKLQLGNSANLKFATAITFKHEALITLSVSTSAEYNYTTQFNFYLKLLPSLSLHDIAIVLTISNSEVSKLNNVFKIPQNYPSTIAFELLRETYGQLYYTHQLHSLLNTCKPCAEINNGLIDSFIKGINKKDDFTLNQLKKWCLPDGLSIYEMLLNYAPLKDENSAIGYLVRPKYYEANKFKCFAENI